MKFDLSIESESQKAVEYFNKLEDQKSLIELKKVSPKRSLSQNNYLHLLIGYFAQNFGYTAAEAKLVYKYINSNLYCYKKKIYEGRPPFMFIRSSADLTVDEMTKSIDRFREWSEKQGCPLPTATDQGWLREIENEIERSQHYL